MIHAAIVITGYCIAIANSYMHMQNELYRSKGGYIIVVTIHVAKCGICHCYGYMFCLLYCSLLSKKLSEIASVKGGMVLFMYQP